MVCALKQFSKICHHLIPRGNALGEDRWCNCQFHSGEEKKHLIKALLISKSITEGNHIAVFARTPIFVSFNLIGGFSSSVSDVTKGLLNNYHSVHIFRYIDISKELTLHTNITS